MMPMLSSEKSKSLLRDQYRTLRKQLDSATRHQHDLAIQRHLLGECLQRSPRVVGAFWPFDGEPNVSPALYDLAKAGITVALPNLQRTTTGTLMTFRQWQPQGRMTTNYYGIGESEHTVEINLSAIDILLMPMVAYDPQGNRLGMGAGFYDRLLAGVRDEPRPARVGVAFAAQQAASLPAQEWDIPLHAVVNENGWFTCPL